MAGHKTRDRKYANTEEKRPDISIVRVNERDEASGGVSCEEETRSGLKCSLVGMLGAKVQMHIHLTTVIICAPIPQPEIYKYSVKVFDKYNNDYYLFNRKAKGPHMNNKIWVENNKTSTLKKEYELDPKQVGLDHVTPKPAENKII